MDGIRRDAGQDYRLTYLLGEGILRETDVALWTPTVPLLSCYFHSINAACLDRLTFWRNIQYNQTILGRKLRLKLQRTS